MRSNTAVAVTGDNHPANRPEPWGHKFVVTPYKKLWEYLIVTSDRVMDSNPTRWEPLNVVLRTAGLIGTILAWLTAVQLLFSLQLMALMFGAALICVFAILLVLAAFGAASGGSSRRRSRTGLRMNSSIPLPGPFRFKLW